MNDPNISFKDVGFELAFRNLISKATGIITKEDLKAVNGIMISNIDANGFSIPWISDGTAFNMTFPNLMFNVNNSDNGEWISDIVLFNEIKSFHIGIAISDLMFLETFTHLKELYLHEYDNDDLSFLNNLISLSSMCIYKGQLKDLTPFATLYKKQLELFKKSKIDKDRFYIFNGLENLYLHECGKIGRAHV